MNLLKSFVCSLGLLVVLSASANAGLIVDNWSLDLDASTGSRTDLVTGIDVINFSQAVNHVTVSDNDMSGTITVGDTAVVRGAISASTFSFDDFGGTFTPDGLNGTLGGWEVTATFLANVTFVADAFGVTGFVHTGGADTFLNLYVDEYGAGSGGVRASTFDGTGFDDGDLIASFTDTVTGGINPFSFTTLNGSDNATFAFDAVGSAGATTGVLLDQNGEDLVGNALAAPPIEPYLAKLVTAEDFERTLPSAIINEWDDVGGQFGPEFWASTFPGAALPVDNSDPLNFFTLGNGDAQLGVVPEPTSAAAWLILGAFGVARRRRK